MAVFDMAGTTVDEDNVVYKTLMRAVNEHGFGLTFDEVLANGAGKEKLQAIRSVLATKQVTDEALASRIFSQFMGMLDEAYESLQVAEQPHTTEMFGELRKSGVAVVLNTGYNRATAERLVRKIGWKEGVDYDCLVTASDVAKNRPDPDMIFRAMEKLGIKDAGAVVKVGDSAIDIEEGKNAGCRLSIGITTGAHTRDQLLAAQPDLVIDDLRELLPVLERLSAEQLAG